MYLSRPDAPAMNSLSCIVLLALAFFPLHSARSQEVPERDELLKITNGTATVGVDRQKGGAITWLSSKWHAENIVNIHDPGRLIQQSYYSGKVLDRTTEGQSKNWSPWPWNPIQGGGVSSWARVKKLEKQGEFSLFGETVPKLWDMPNEEAAATMQQWTTFDEKMSNVIVVRNRLQCIRQPGDRWGPAAARHQEVPACYFIRSFDHFASYLGDSKWRREVQAAGPPWGKAQPPLNAMACFHSSGQGVAVYSPTANRHWNFGPHVKKMSELPEAAPCVHIAPITRVRLGPKSTFEYRYWLILGDRDGITACLETLMVAYRDERSVLHDAQ
ncbi:MAG: hypothetical protein Aurels2KO_34760 [Aureliella sp.]